MQIHIKINLRLIETCTNHGMIIQFCMHYLTNITTTISYVDVYYSNHIKYSKQTIFSIGTDVTP